MKHHRKAHSETKDLPRSGDITQQGACSSTVLRNSVNFSQAVQSLIFKETPEIQAQSEIMSSGGDPDVDGSRKGETEHPPKVEELSAEDLASRIAALQARNDDLTKQKERMADELKLRKLEKDNADLDAWLFQYEADRRRAELPSKSMQRTGGLHRSSGRRGVSDRESSESEHSNMDNIQKLRRLESLQRKAEQELQAWGLDSERETDNDGYSTRGMPRKQRKGKKPHIPQPQDSLGFEYVTQKKTFDDLDIRLFVSGELGIMSAPGISREELEGRRDLLKILMYHAGNYQWKAVKNLYSVVIDSIYVKKDRKWENWDHDLSRLETMMLMSYPLPKGDQGGKGGTNGRDKPKKQNNNNQNYFKNDDEVDNQVWYCTAFNKGNCKHSQPHNHFVAGKTRVVQHICATCHKKKEYLPHREKCAECPNNN